MYKEKNNIIKRTASIMLAMVMAITVYSVVPISAATAADNTKKSAVTKYNSNIRTGAGTGYKKVGDKVKEGDILATLQGNSKKKLLVSAAICKDSFHMAGTRPEKELLIRSIIGL